METTTKHYKAKKLRGWLGATKLRQPQVFVASLGPGVPAFRRTPERSSDLLWKPGQTASVKKREERAVAVKTHGIPFWGIGAPPILEPILVGIGMFTGDFDSQIGARETKYRFLKSP